VTNSPSEPLDPPSNSIREHFENTPPNLKLLGYAWERFDTYNDNASKAQNRFFFVRGLLAYLSVLVVFLSVLQPVILIRVSNSQAFEGQDIGDMSLIALFVEATQGFSWNNPNTWLTPFSWIGGLALVDFLLILLPILVTGLLAFAVKFDRGHNWILLRGNSESLKMEIYHYRTRTKQYKHHRNSTLAERIQLISERVKGSAVHQAALSPYEGQPPTRLKRGIVVIFFQKLMRFLRRRVRQVLDFLFQFREVEDNSQTESDQSQSPEEKAQAEFLEFYADLDADAYIHYRLEDQFNWYRSKAKTYDRNYQVLQASVYFFGGVGTLLAAIGFQNWVAFSTALATSFASYLEYKRVEATLVGYNQAADALYDIRAWWFSLSPEERAKTTNFDKLVVSTEETIRSEHTSWLQDMQDRLANLYGDTGDEEASESEFDQYFEGDIPPPSLPESGPTGGSDEESSPEADSEP
jgi:hypothetical protein